MIVLDTNVLSELMKLDTSPSVARWIVRVGEEDVRTTAVARAEILAGIADLPEGRRRQALRAAADAVFHARFEGRILSFDTKAADQYGEILADRRRLGRPIKTLDAMIAAVARAHGAAVATRDTGGFADCGIAVIDPWQGP